MSEFSAGQQVAYKGPESTAYAAAAQVESVDGANVSLRLLAEDRRVAASVDQVEPDEFFPIDMDTYEGFIRGDLIVRCPKHPIEHDALLYGFDEVGLIKPSCGCRGRKQYGMSKPEVAS